MEPAKKLCELCGENEPNDGRKVCSVCMGLDEKEELPDGTLSCLECGHPKTPGEMHAKRRGWCKVCVSESMTNARALKKAKASELPSQYNQVTDPPTRHILIDLTDHEELLLKIANEAREELRTPDMHTLWILLQHFKESSDRGCAPR